MSDRYCRGLGHEFHHDGKNDVTGEQAEDGQKYLESNPNATKGEMFAELKKKYGAKKAAEITSEIFEDIGCYDFQTQIWGALKDKFGVSNRNQDILYSMNSAGNAIFNEYLAMKYTLGQEKSGQKDFSKYVDNPKIAEKQLYKERMHILKAMKSLMGNGKRYDHLLSEYSMLGGFVTQADEYYYLLQNGGEESQKRLDLIYQNINIQLLYGKTLDFNKNMPNMTTVIDIQTKDGEDGNEVKTYNFYTSLVNLNTNKKEVFYQTFKFSNNLSDKEKSYFFNINQKLYTDKFLAQVRGENTKFKNGKVNSRDNEAYKPKISFSKQLGLDSGYDEIDAMNGEVSGKFEMTENHFAAFLQFSAQIAKISEFFAGGNNCGLVLGLDAITAEAGANVYRSETRTEIGLEAIAKIIGGELGIYVRIPGTKIVIVIAAKGFVGAGLQLSVEWGVPTEAKLSSDQKAYLNQLFSLTAQYGALFGAGLYISILKVEKEMKPGENFDEEDYYETDQ